jgi:hypothetical protein
MQKILYFIAGVSPTVGEQAEIDAIVPATAPQFELGIRTNMAGANYGEGRLEPADFVAGTPPVAYDVLDDEDARVYPIFDPDNLPESGIEANQVVLTDADVIAILDGDGVSADATVAVAAGVDTYELEATAAIVNSGDARAIAVTGVYATTVTFTVVAGEITAIALS